MKSECTLIIVLELWMLGTKENKIDEERVQVNYFSRVNKIDGC
jgi:hypothetical protein